MKVFNFAEACDVLCLPRGRMWNWLLRNDFRFSHKSATGRRLFTESDLFSIAIARDFISVGVEPNLAFRWSASIVERSHFPPLPFDAHADPAATVAPELVPTGAPAPRFARRHIILDLRQIYLELTARISLQKRRAA